MTKEELELSIFDINAFDKPGINCHNFKVELSSCDFNIERFMYYFNSLGLAFIQSDR